MDPYVALMLAKFCRAVTSVRAMLAPVCPVWPKRPAYTASPAVNQSQLDAELAEFVASLLAGVIYLSMGSSVRMVRVPAATLCQLFAAVLARLPRHHVLRTWAGIEEYSIDDLELLSALPATVRVRDWLLQKDILGHNQILKLFIIHGGLLSQHDLVQHGGIVGSWSWRTSMRKPLIEPYTLFCIMIAVGYANQSTLPLITQPTN